MKRLLALAFACAILMGCETTPREVVKTVEVKVPVKVPCIESAPTRPVMLTGQGQYPGDKEAASLLIRDLEAFEQYGTDWEAAAAGCLKPSNTNQPAPDS